ncbi:YbaB/EbfC family nucleoid-associated protein [uncultured Megasphaera sp.]|uniref:YbaB/EbfC family nucleoid-associated protein n=1 Tax=uncultured Megasphaera sp. TaxID=165188 RepID=UPI002593E519|nr:YbaB/EbfC family nucleoid-associated protein [uncultured Megasphaera sp.]
MFGGNMQGMMKKVEKMQKEMERLQNELKNRTVEAGVGGGALTITINGAKVVQSVHIDSKIVDPEDTEMLEDLIVAAVNEANKKVDEMMSEEMSKITNGMRIPGLF